MWPVREEKVPQFETLVIVPEVRHIEESAKGDKSPPGQTSLRRGRLFFGDCVDCYTDRFVLFC